MFKNLILIFPLMGTVLLVQAQEKAPVKFGDVSAKDFQQKIYSIDSNAAAVVIADIGSSKYEGNTKGFVSLEFKYYRRAHILNKNGYDLADVEIGIYSSNNTEEKIGKIKAVTYNLENGKVVETKLDAKRNVFKDPVNKNWTLYKFTMPDVKEGSIIEYEYNITSEFMTNLQPWTFQGKYPRLWSEYNVAIPQFFAYVFLSQGDRMYDINDKKDRTSNFHITESGGVGAMESYTFNTGVTDYRWVKKNVKPLKEENYTSTLNNHVAKLEFQLSELREPLKYQRIMGTWEKLADDLLRDEDFGEQLDKNNGWLKDEVAPLLVNANSKEEIAHNIYNYVRDNYVATDYGGVYMRQPLKNLLKTKRGRVPEINLLLTTMLKMADVEADPVILSTRSHGYVYSLYPILSRFDYVISRCNIDGKLYYLDASEPDLGFGFLPIRCYNGHARVINKYAEAVEIDPQLFVEKEFASVFIINDSTGKLIGSMQKTPGYYASLDVREKVKKEGLSSIQDSYKKAAGSEIAISNLQVDSLKRLEDVVKVSFDFDMNKFEDDIIYMNPIMFGQGYKENPFKSAERLYPVEMPFKMDETYTMQLEIPAGYVVDELPQQVVAKMNEKDDGFFEYRISASGNMISFRTRVAIARTVFFPEEYQMLRDFFALVVKKHAEQIVFKKKEE